MQITQLKEVVVCFKKKPVQIQKTYSNEYFTMCKKKYNTYQIQFLQFCQISITCIRFCFNLPTNFKSI